jgi:hypothetical protein
LICSITIYGCDRGLVGDPPTVQLVAAGGDVRTSYRGEKYYLSNDQIGFKAVAEDPEDGTLTSILLLNDEPYEPGTPITKPGTHTIHARSVDSDGNTSTDFKRFKVQRDEEAESHIKLLSLEPYLDEADKEFLKATISIELPKFDVNEIDVCMIRLMGEVPGTSGFRRHVDGAWDQDGVTETPNTADARIDSEKFICVISGIPPSTDTSTLEVIGGGKGYPDSFSYWEDVQIPETATSE